MEKHLVLLHGFCESKHMWDDFISVFGKDYHVHCLDLPGFGDFHFDIKGFSMADIAQVVQNEINALQLPSYVLVGHSLGAYVGLEILNQFPQKIKGLGLFHSTAYADSEERKAKRNDVIRFVDKHGSTVFGSSFIPQLFFKEKREACKSDIEKLTQIASSTSKETLMEVTRAMQGRNDHIELIKKVDIPLLYIVGKHDESVPLDLSMSQVREPKDCSLLLLDDCGHMGMFEQRDKTQQFVKAYVDYCYR